MIGGYPNEMQMLMMMKAGYVLSTSNFFFFYFVAIALLFLIGQRTQRTVLQKEEEDENNGSFQRVNEDQGDENGFQKTTEEDAALNTDRMPQPRSPEQRLLVNQGEEQAQDTSRTEKNNHKYVQV